MSDARALRKRRTPIQADNDAAARLSARIKMAAPEGLGPRRRCELVEH